MKVTDKTLVVRVFISSYSPKSAFFTVCLFLLCLRVQRLPPLDFYVTTNVFDLQGIVFAVFTYLLFVDRRYGDGAGIDVKNVQITIKNVKNVKRDRNKKTLRR